MSDYDYETSYNDYKTEGCYGYFNQCDCNDCLQRDYDEEEYLLSMEEDPDYWIANNSIDGTE